MIVFRQFIDWHGSCWYIGDQRAGKKIPAAKWAYLENAPTDFRRRGAWEEMQNTGYLALSRQATMNRQLDMIANNIANANTPGYRAERMMFSDYLHDTGRDSEVAFVRDVSVARDLTPGELYETANPFDIAINGEGYFTIDGAMGTRFTRNGHFRLDTESRLVTSQGFPVLDDRGGEITIPPNAVEISLTPTGVITDGTTPIARLGVVTFENEQSLRNASQGMFIADEEPIVMDEPSIAQGMLERANVEPVLEISRMMTLMRSFEAAQDLVTTEHDNQRKAIDRIMRQA